MSNGNKALSYGVNLADAILLQLIADPLVRAQVAPMVEALKQMADEGRDPTPEELQMVRDYIDSMRAGIHSDSS